MSHRMNTLTQIARQAGKILLEGYGRAKKIEFKGDIDLVTEFDRRSDAFILAQLRQNFPGEAILSEESGQDMIISDYVWIVDPLDGTTNFAHSFPAFAVSIGLTFQGQPYLGVVYDPLRDELYAAEAGQGATLNGEPLRVSPETNLDRALLATGFPYDLRTNPRNNFEQFVHFYKQVQGIRHTGSAALDCVWVAAGRLEGFWEFDLSPWDVAAGGLIAREAGGRVTSVEGQEDFLNHRSLVVSNGYLHDQMLQILSTTVDPLASIFSAPTK